MKRLIAFFLCTMFVVGCQEKIDQKKFENLHRAAKTVQGSISIGVNYTQFNEFLQRFATEISIAQDITKSEFEKKMISEYGKLLQIYKDSRELWKRKIEAPPFSGIPKDCIIVIDNDPIATEYSLQVINFLPPKASNTYHCVPEDSIPKIWGYADKQFEKAAQLYFGVK